MDVALLTPLIQLVGFLIATIVVVVSMRHELKELRADVHELKVDVKQFAGILTSLAIQNERINLLDRRYEELRHGEGFVYPLMGKGP